VNPRVPDRAAIQSLVPYAHVADVERSLAFYERLGFARGDVVKGSSGTPVWGSLHRGGAHLFVALATEPIDPRAQAVLFYAHTADVRALREHLLACGAKDGGEFAASAGHGPYVRAMEPPSAEGVVFSIVARPYMPGGELRVHDPDGYCLLIGQPGA
jgi:catechol 2,3-dioxygenase-like lactoylglutathione lyase family enzyme